MLVPVKTDGGQTPVTRRGQWTRRLIRGLCARPRDRIRLTIAVTDDRSGPGVSGVRLASRGHPARASGPTAHGPAPPCVPPAQRLAVLEGGRSIAAGGARRRLQVPCRLGPPCIPQRHHRRGEHANRRPAHCGARGLHRPTGSRRPLPLAPRSSVRRSSGTGVVSSQRATRPSWPLLPRTTIWTNSPGTPPGRRSTPSTDASDPSRSAGQDPTRAGADPGTRAPASLPGHRRADHQHHPRPLAGGARRPGQRPRPPERPQL